MLTAKFNNVSSETLGFIITDKLISAPKPKTNFVSVPGSDGSLDLSEFNGVRYEDREITLKCISKDYSVNHFQELENALHGRLMFVEFSDDNKYYWIARVSMDAWKRNMRTGEFSLRLICKPYKFAYNGKQETFTGVKRITVEMPTIPTITVSANGTAISLGDYSVTLSAGEYTLPELELKRGINEITASNQITVMYEVGSL